MSEIPPRSPAGGPPEHPARTADAATRVFVEHRELLFSIVYNLLGSVADTEDVLQETWLSWAPRNQAPGGEPIDNPRGYLVRVAVNQALARQAAIKRQRETYLGPWLPEPLVTSGDAAERAERIESVSIALLVVLGNSVPPGARGVRVARGVWLRPRRDRRHPRPQPGGDPPARPPPGNTDGASGAEVTFWADGGGKLPRAALRPVHGRDNVARVFIGLAARPPEGLDRPAEPADLVGRGGRDPRRRAAVLDRRTERPGPARGLPHRPRRAGVGRQVRPARQ